MKDILFKEDVAEEDWSEHEGFPKIWVVCSRSHQYYSQTKFSGALVAIIARDPCPVCGAHSLKFVNAGLTEQPKEDSCKTKHDPTGSTS